PAPDEQWRTVAEDRRVLPLQFLVVGEHLALRRTADELQSPRRRGCPRLGRARSRCEWPAAPPEQLCDRVARYRPCHPLSRLVADPDARIDRTAGNDLDIGARLPRQRSMPIEPAADTTGARVVRRGSEPEISELAAKLLQEASRLLDCDQGIERVGKSSRP